MAYATKFIGGKTHVAYAQSEDVGLDETISSGSPRFFEAVMLHLSKSGGEGDATDFTVTLESGISTSQDINLLTTDMATSQDVFWQPEFPIPMAKEDGLVCAYSNGNGVNYGLQVFWRTTA